MAEKTRWFLFYAVLDWLIIVVCCVLQSYINTLWSFLFLTFIVATRIHSAAILGHDGIHGHASSNRKVNDMLTDFFCFYPCLRAVGIFRKTHLLHHDTVSTAHDPDLQRRLAQPNWRFPKESLWQFFKFLLEAPYYSVTMDIFRTLSRWRMIFQSSWDKNFVKAIWMIIALGLLTFEGGRVSLAMWALGLIILVPMLAYIRNIAEHFAIPQGEGITRDLTVGWVESFLFAPHNSGYHAFHHEFPEIPFYDLPRKYKEYIHKGLYKDFHSPYTSFFWPSERSLIKDIIKKEEH